MICLLFHMILPLTPLLLEYILTGLATSKTLLLSATMYSVSVCGSSQSKLWFGAGVFIAIVFAALFGLSTHAGTSLEVGIGWPLASIGFVFITHALERYNRHIVDRTPFWEF